MKIGFIGLGNVGGKLAGSLIRNKFDVHYHKLNPDLTDTYTSYLIDFITEKNIEELNFFESRVFFQAEAGNEI